MTRAVMTRMTVLAFIWSSGPVVAHVPPGLADCHGISDDALRLECYDEAMRTAAAAPSEPAGGDDAGVEEAFGKEARLETEREKLDELRAGIVRVDAAQRDRRVFVLDNGQVWAEQSANERLKVTVGDPVRIRAGSLGSFRLFVEGGKLSTRVERVR